MKQDFQGWSSVANRLSEYADSQQKLALAKGESATRLNAGQRASLHAISERIPKNGIVIADEVGMGKTRIAVELARAVTESGGRVVILVPPGLGYQWQAELRDGKVDAPPILRSLSAYLDAWKPDPSEEPWFDEPVVVISHAFTNWRLGKDTLPWRWALLPELYARWRKQVEGRLPRGYHGNEKLADERVARAAASICASIPNDERHKAWQLIDELSRRTPWPGAFDGSEYGRNQDLRPWLEQAVGLGLGIFDLIIIDEAHKSRRDESGLSRLLDKVVLSSEEARRLAMTATPVELDVSQWQQILSRIGLGQKSLVPVEQAIEQYAAAVERVRQSWRSSSEARCAFKNAAIKFKEALSPYLLRRDKREDQTVKTFERHSSLPINAYREETEIAVETNTLTPAWRQAVCAAEALSIVTHQADDPIAKRLRLTLGNGHGVSALLDQIKRDKELDRRQEEFDLEEHGKKLVKASDHESDKKRQARAQWWLDVTKYAFSNSDDSLFDHPALGAAVEAIEKAIQQKEKVLVFGRFTRPLRALVDLLNAREMLRRLQNGSPWPQVKVHGERDCNLDNSEWPAVRAAHRQLKCSLSLDEIDSRLHTSYNLLRRKREKLREHLIESIENGLEDIGFDQRIHGILGSFKNSARVRTSGESDERHPLALVGRAIEELLGGFESDFKPPDYARAFSELIQAVSDRDEGDTNHDGQLDEIEASKLWGVLEERLHEEYNRPQGGFARLMFGGTKPESRRMIQLAFNRHNSFPKVLVAQSMVGREGLNLHKACRIVVLLHPEWNPGVVEQQIGRVDRVGSHWASKLEKAIEEGTRGDQLPRIEVRPVIFRGTYDEYNWQVLRERWDDLRAQLHGVVIPPKFAETNPECQELIEEIVKSAPNFSPCGLTKPRYHIEDVHIIDTESKPPKRINIREILDFGSAEFNQSQLSKQEKLEVIADLGLDSLTQALDRCYKNKGGGLDYNAARDAKFTSLFLRKMTGQIDRDEFISSLKASD
jgi:superfamily II DNA or RNA helicase